MRTHIVQLETLDAAHRIATVQEPIFQLFRRLFKGSYFATSEYCEADLVDPAAETTPVLLVYDDDDDGDDSETKGVGADARLVGASWLKFVPSEEVYKGKRVTFLGVTIAFGPSVRGASIGQPFMVGEMIKYTEAHPDRLVCMLDVSMSPVSYHVLIANMSLFCDVYPQEDSAVPAELEAAALRRMDQLTRYPAVNPADRWVRKGPQPRESIEQAFARYTRGAHENPITQYYYRRTGAIAGHGLITLMMVRPDLLAESRTLFDSFLQNRSAISERAVPRFKLRPSQFVMPEHVDVNFALVAQLRAAAAKPYPHLHDHVVPHLATVLSDSFARMDGQHLLRFITPADGKSARVAALSLLERMAVKDIAVVDRAVLVAGPDALTLGAAAVLMGSDQVTVTVRDLADIPSSHFLTSLPGLVTHDAAADAADSLMAFDVVLWNWVDRNPKDLPDALRAAATQLHQGGELIVLVSYNELSLETFGKLLSSMRGSYDVGTLRCIVDVLADAYLVLYRLTKSQDAHLVLDHECKQAFALTKICDGLTRLQGGPKLSPKLATNLSSVLSALPIQARL